MSNVTSTTDPSVYRRRINKLLGSQVPRYLFKAFAAGLKNEGDEFKREMRERIRPQFKTGGQRVANAIRFYTDGSSFANLELGVFTRWNAAPIYERGGPIVAKRSYLVIPVTPRAYTPGGRVRRTWRNKEGQFHKHLFEGLRPIPVKGGFLLVRDRGVTRTGRLGKVTKKRGVQAVEPVFLLTKRTSRDPVLNFISTFISMSGARHRRLSIKIGDALTAAARTPE